MEDVQVEVRGENGAYYAVSSLDWFAISLQPLNPIQLSSQLSFLLQAYVRDMFDDGFVVVSFENK